MSVRASSVAWTIVGPQAHPDVTRVVHLATDVLLAVLNESGIQTWNEFSAAWYNQNWLCPCWSEGQSPPSIIINLDFANVRFSNIRLDKLDLRFASLRGATFNGTSLREAQFSVCDLTDAVFVNPGLDKADFEGAYYKVGHPPRGLPDNLLQACVPIE
jgi:hypothetical protein